MGGSDLGDYDRNADYRYGAPQPHWYRPGWSGPYTTAVPGAVGAEFGGQQRSGGGQGAWGPSRDEPASVYGTYGPHTGRGPRNYRGTDERIHDTVCDRLTRHGDVDASDIEVEVQNGEVTLRGTVPDRRQKRAAEDAVENIPGVQDVHNRLTIQESS